MIASELAIFFAAVSILLLVYLYVVYGLINAYKKIMADIITTQMMQITEAKAGMHVIMQLFHAYIKKVNQKYDTDLLSDENFSVQELDLFSILLKNTKS